jgi:catechol 2,3-dioxygenase-like lactoylglutathione lyase family enzyme
VSGPGGLLGPPVQIAYAVGDVFDAARQWVEHFGAGPFFVRPHIELIDVTHRGRPSTFDHSSAYGQWGPIMVELVQDHTNGPSVISDVYAEGGFGVHHLAFFVDDLRLAQHTQQARGHDVAMTARTPGGVEFCFIDTLATHGHLLELYSRSDRLTTFYEMVATAARDWDGRDPIRQ